jgi:integral membrane protein
MLINLVLCLILVYGVMASLFESFLQPFSILLTCLLGCFGAPWAMWLTRTTVDTAAMIGLFILIGIVVNNGIMLVDRTLQLRAEGVERGEALAQAGQDRIRPILMTAGTTILGVVPMILHHPTLAGVYYHSIDLLADRGPQPLCPRRLALGRPLTYHRRGVRSHPWAQAASSTTLRHERTMQLTTPIGRLRLIGLLEGSSFLILLGIAMPLKYLAHRPEAVKIVGSAHGFLFLVFVLALFHAASDRDWPLKKIAAGFIASVLPFGTFIFDANLRREVNAEAEAKAETAAPK